jgi:GxxExxY protein
MQIVGSRGGAKARRNDGMRPIDEISGDVLHAALQLHRELGPGLLESVYEILLAKQLEQLGYKVDRQRPIDINYHNIFIPAAFKIDLMIDDQLIIELKSTEQMHPLHGKQLLTYLRLVEQPVGLLINFGQQTLKEGFKRIVNNYEPSASPRLRVNNDKAAIDRNNY